MESVNIQPYRTFDDGIALHFRGVERDAEGEPMGEEVSVELIVPPLNFDSLRRQKGQVESLSSGTADSMAALVDLMLTALRQNYRSVPRWLVEQSVNVGNMTDWARAVMDVSGFMRKELAEAKKATAAAQSTGTESTAT